MTSWRQRAIWIGAFVALSALLAGLLVADHGLWDWDTYQRVQFLPEYRDDLVADTHILYHHAIRALMALGLSPNGGIVVVTATSAAAFLLLVVHAAIRAGLSRRAQVLVMIGASLASPGLVSLFVLREDNLPYLPLLFALYALLYREDRERASAVRAGIVGGVLVALGMLLNISLLVIPIGLVPVCLLWRWMPLRALRAAVLVGVTFAAYYLIHLTVFHGARIALHEFLPQALALRDPTTQLPLFSTTRLEQYLGGLRAIALHPSVHLMRMSDTVHAALVVVLPKVLAGLYVLVAVDTLRRDRRAVWKAVWRRVDVVAIAGVALGFPYLYEPFLIERWDIMWSGLVLLLVVYRARTPSRLARVSIIAIVVIQSLGTVVTIAHRDADAFVDPEQVRLRTATARLHEERRHPLIFATDIDRAYLAEIATRTQGQPLYLLGERDGEVRAYRVLFLDEQPAPLDEVRAALAGAHLPYLDARLTPRMRAAIGR